MFFFIIITAYIIFKENDLVMIIVVMEKLDKLKKGDDLINFHAKDFTRELDNIPEDNLKLLNSLCYLQ